MGSGVFTQTGGTHALTGNLYLGFNSGANGSYNLSAGLLDPTDEYVGYSDRRLTQSGGTHVVTSSPGKGCRSPHGCRRSG